MKTIHPIDAVIGINYKCNSRCIMCDIWKIIDFPEILADEYLKLPASLLDVNISGGEPFLRTDIVQVVKNIRQACPKARIVISTNGFLPDLVEKRMQEILKFVPEVGVAISVDGVGEMHEAVRRIPDAYNKCVDTLTRLKKLGMTNLRWAFTIIPENIEHFGKVYDDARARGIQFTHSFAQSSDNFFGGKHIDNHPNAKILREQYEHIISGELKSWNLKRWARAYYAFSLYNFIIQREQPLNNDPGTKFFYLHSDGTVFPSVVHNYPLGNLTQVKNWQELWQSEEADKARGLVKTVGAPAWMICTARTAIRKHWLRVGMWILKNKFGGVKI